MKIFNFYIMLFMMAMITQLDLVGATPAVPAFTVSPVQINHFSVGQTGADTSELWLRMGINGTYYLLARNGEAGSNASHYETPLQPTIMEILNNLKFEDWNAGIFFSLIQADNQVYLYVQQADGTPLLAQPPFSIPIPNTTTLANITSWTFQGSYLAKVTVPNSNTFGLYVPAQTALNNYMIIPNNVTSLNSLGFNLPYLSNVIQTTIGTSGLWIAININGTLYRLVDTIGRLSTTNYLDTGTTTSGSISAMLSSSSLDWTKGVFFSFVKDNVSNIYLRINGGSDQLFPIPSSVFGQFNDIQGSVQFGGSYMGATSILPSQTLCLSTSTVTEKYFQVLYGNVTSASGIPINTSQSFITKNLLKFDSTKSIYFPYQSVKNSLISNSIFNINKKTVSLTSQLPANVSLTLNGYTPSITSFISAAIQKSIAQGGFSMILLAADTKGNFTKNLSNAANYYLYLFDQNRKLISGMPLIFPASNMSISGNTISIGGLGLSSPILMQYPFNFTIEPTSLVSVLANLPSINQLNSLTSIPSQQLPTLSLNGSSISLSPTILSAMKKALSAGFFSIVLLAKDAKGNIISDLSPKMIADYYIYLYDQNGNLIPGTPLSISASDIRLNSTNPNTITIGGVGLPSPISAEYPFYMKQAVNIPSLNFSTFPTLPFKQIGIPTISSSSANAFIDNKYGGFQSPLMLNGVQLMTNILNNIYSYINPNYINPKDKIWDNANNVYNAYIPFYYIILAADKNNNFISDLSNSSITTYYLYGYINNFNIIAGTFAASEFKLDSTNKNTITITDFNGNTHQAIYPFILQAPMSLPIR